MAKDGLRALFHCYKLNYWAQSMPNVADEPDFPIRRAQFICQWNSNKEHCDQGGWQRWNHISIHYTCIKTQDDAIFYLDIIINGNCCALCGHYLDRFSLLWSTNGIFQACFSHKDSNFTFFWPQRQTVPMLHASLCLCMCYGYWWWFSL